MNLKPSQKESLIMFRRSLSGFVNFSKKLNLKDRDDLFIVEKTVDLRKRIIEIRQELIFFVNEIGKIILELEKVKFRDFEEKKAPELKRKIYENIRDQLRSQTRKDLLEHKDFQSIIFNLTEILEEFVYIQTIMDNILNKKNSVPALFSYLIDIRVGLQDHVLNSHIDDLASFEDGELIFSKGIMSSIADFLEKYCK